MIKLSLGTTKHHKHDKWAASWQNQQNDLCVRPVWSESSLSPQWVAKDPSFLHADSEDSDQTGWMTCVFPGCTCHFVGFVMRQLKLFSKQNNETKKIGHSAKPLTYIEVHSKSPIGIPIKNRINQFLSCGAGGLQGHYWGSPGGIFWNFCLVHLVVKHWVVLANDGHFHSGKCCFHGKS